MAMASSSSRILCSTHRPILKPNSFPLWSHQPTRTLNFTVVSATPKKQQLSSSSSSSSPRTGRFDSKNRRTSPVITTKEEEETVTGEIPGDEIDSTVAFDDGFVMPELPGDKPDLFEGPQWDALGFFVQYMWAFGVVFALAACGIAVATYNEGATDFKDTPAYKESMESQELLEIPDASNSDVFESNPTEEAPSLE